jgi:molecular chaperone GrpE
MTSDDQQRTPEQPNEAHETAIADEAQAQPDPIAALEQERDQFKALAQRTQADFINYKRRAEEERGMIARSVSGQVLGKLLTVLDDLQRAVKSIPSDAPAAWTDGIRLVSQNFEAIMESEGVSKYDPAPGETFDPVQHEAIYYQPTDDQPAGAVLTVERSGYKTKDRILRPAQVVVARSQEQTGD